MARGREEFGGGMMPLNTKLHTETKRLIDALVKIKDLGGQRQLIEAMLDSYCKQNPADFIKAQELIKMLGMANPTKEEEEPGAGNDLEEKKKPLTWTIPSN